MRSRALKWLKLGLDIYLAHLLIVYAILGLVLVARYIKEPTCCWYNCKSSLLAELVDLSSLTPASTSVVTGFKLLLLKRSNNV